MRRALLPVLILVLSSCTRLGGGPRAQAATETVTVTPEAVMAAAITTLQQEGWTVNRLADGTVATSPRALPPTAQTEATRDQQWMVQVAASPMFRLAGTQMSVAAFIIPAAANQPPDSTLVTRAVPITDRNPTLWPEVRGLASRIARAAQPRRR